MCEFHQVPALHPGRGHDADESDTRTRAQSHEVDARDALA